MEYALIKKSLALFLVTCCLISNATNPYKPDKKLAEISGWELIWHDEFSKLSKPDTTKWRYETGFVRNEELQWYSENNAICHKGVLLIEARTDTFPNPKYEYDSDNWKKSREKVTITSASINTRKKFSFQYGRFEVRARIDTTCGSWPAIWTLGVEGHWPANGEIDQMEFYRVHGVPTLLANVAHAGKDKWKPTWDSSRTPLSVFLKKDTKWTQKFHVWRMDWDAKSIKLYLDNVLLNTTELTNTKNANGIIPAEPFKQPHYILLNLAIGSNGGTLRNNSLPIKYEVDYVRVYQKIVK